jgi:hypothetical protein
LDHLDKNALIDEQIAIFAEKDIPLGENQDEIILRQLFVDHPVEMKKVIYEKLRTRPTTLVHQDMRCENIFISKVEPY